MCDFIHILFMFVCRTRQLQVDLSKDADTCVHVQIRSIVFVFNSDILDKV